MTPLLKPIVRKTDRPFMHYRTPLVVTLLPGDVISLRLLRHKRQVVFNLHTLYYHRSEIGSYLRPAPRYLALPKIIRDATPTKSSFSSTDGASQVKCSEEAVAFVKARSL